MCIRDRYVRSTSATTVYYEYSGAVASHSVRTSSIGTNIVRAYAPPVHAIAIVDYVLRTERRKEERKKEGKKKERVGRGRVKRLKEKDSQRGNPYTVHHI